MNRKMINSILVKKHNKFVESIKDSAVRELVRENSIISGGSIASMLMREKVNDYDYYFKNHKTVLAVVSYYVKLFNKLNPDTNVKPKVWVDKKRVRIKIKSAGVASEDNKDEKYKYFENYPLEEGEEYISEIIKTVEEADDLSAEELKKAKEKYRPIFMTDNAISLSDKTQLVIRFYGNAEEIHENYDYVHCTNYWESSTGKVVLRQEALESLMAKQLYYVGSKYPVCSMVRMRKFIKRGWHINAGQMLKIAMQISQLDLTDINVLDEQLVGVDTAYFRQLIDHLRKKKEEKPDFNLDMPYLITLIDKIL